MGTSNTSLLTGKSLNYYLLGIFQLTYSTTRYGLYEVVTSELKNTNGKLLDYLKFTR